MNDHAAIAALRAGWASLSPEDQAEGLRILDAIERDMRAHPLAYVELWHRDPPRTSQRAAAQAVLDGGLFHFTLGGNRSGKSASGAQLDWAYALGSDHPDVRRWAERNALDVSAVPRGPGTVWSVALTSGDSRRYVRPKLAELAPVGTRWRNMNGDGEAEAIAPNGARVVFKSVDQGRDGFQGDKVRRIRFDEEPRDPEVIKEAKMRIVDMRGHLHFTMTPLHGWTSLLDEYVRVPRANTSLRWLHGTDNPHVPQDMLEALLKTYGPHEQAARARGDIVALEGRVYPMWDRAVHVVPHFKPPADWLRYEAWDFGARNPTAVVFAAYDLDTDTIHFYAEHYAAERTISEHAATVKAIEAEYGEPDMRWADPEGRQQIVDLIRDHDMQMAKARKDVRAGINAVCERLAVGRTGSPGLLVHDNCTAFIREIEGYVWDTTNTKLDQPDRPLKRDDHLMDAGRYVIVGIHRIFGRWVEERAEAVASE